MTAEDRSLLSWHVQLQTSVTAPKVGRLLSHRKGVGGFICPLLLRGGIFMQTQRQIVKVVREKEMD